MNIDYVFFSLSYNTVTQLIGIPSKHMRMKQKVTHLEKTHHCVTSGFFENDNHVSILRKYPHFLFLSLVDCLKSKYSLQFEEVTWKYWGRSKT